MGDAFEGLTIRIGADTKNLASALAQTKKKAAEAQKALRKLEAASKIDPTSIKTAESRIAAAGDAAALAATKVAKIERAIADVGEQATKSDPSKTYKELAGETDNCYVSLQRLTDEYNTIDDTLRRLKQQAYATANELKMDDVSVTGLLGEELDAEIAKLDKAGKLTDEWRVAVGQLKTRWHEVSTQMKDMAVVSEMSDQTAEVRKQRAQVTKLTESVSACSTQYMRMRESAGLDSMTAKMRVLNGAVEDTRGELQQVRAVASLTETSAQQMAKQLKTSFDSMDKAVESASKGFAEMRTQIAEAADELGGFKGRTLTQLQDDAEKARLEVQRLESSLAEANGELSEQKQRLVELKAQYQRAQAAGTTMGEKLTAEMKKAETAVEKSETEVESLRTELKTASQAYDSSRLIAELKKQDAAVAESQTKLAGMATTATASSSYAGTFYNVRSFGTALSATTTTAAMMGIYSIINSADEVDSAYRDMRKTVEATEEEYEQLKETAIEFSQTHVTDAATVMEIEAMGGQLGIASDALDEFATVISNLDVATDIDAEDAAESLGKLANITGMTEAEYESFGDTLVRMGNNFAAMESDIMDITTRYASQGAIVGMSTDEMLAWSTAASATGMKAESAGSSMQRFIAKVEKATANGGDSLEAFASVAGMSASELSEAWESDPSSVMQSIVEGLAAIDASGGSVTSTLADLGITNTRDIQLMSGLAQSTDTLSDALAQAEDAWTTGGDAEEEAQKKAEGFSGQLSILQNNAQVLASEFGEALAPAIGTLAEVVQNITDWFGDLNDEQKQTVLKLGAIVTAAGPVLTVFGATGQVLGRFVDRAAKSAASMAELAMSGQSIPGLYGKVVKLTGSTDKLGVSMQTASGVTTVATKRAKLLMAASSALKGGLVALAVAGVAALASALGSYISEQAEAKQETEDLEDAVARMGKAAEDADDEIDESIGLLELFGDEAEDATDSWSDYVDAMQDSADAIESTSDDYELEMSKIAACEDVLDDYLGVSGLNTKQQGELKTAIEYLNDALDTEYRVVDAANGVISDSEGNYDDAKDAAGDYKDEIYDLIAAHEDEVKAEALTEEWSELYSARESTADEYMDKLAEVKDLENKYASVSSQLENTDPLSESYSTLRTEKASVKKDLDEAQAQVDELKGTYDDLTVDMDIISGEMAEATGDIADDTAEAIDAIAEALGGTDSLEYSIFSGAVQDAGYNMADFVELLDDSEDAMNTFSSMSDAELQSAGDTIAAALDMLDGLDISDKTFTVSADGTSVEIAGLTVEELDALGIDDKYFEVTDNGTIKIATDGLGDIITAAAEVPETVELEAETSGFDVTISQLKEIWGQIKKIYKIAHDSKFWKVFVSSGSVTYQGDTSGNAAGGYTDIPRFATGAIVTAETLTRHGYVGEAGAEAIVPLTNRRYAQPFVDLLASGLAAQGAASSENVTNVYLGNVQAAPESEVYAATLALVEAAGVTARRRS